MGHSADSLLPSNTNFIFLTRLHFRIPGPHGLGGLAMENTTPGPYLPLKVDNGTEDRFRLLSLAPGNYDDPIAIQLSTHVLPPTAHAMCVEISGYMDAIYADLSQAVQAAQVDQTREEVRVLYKLFQTMQAYFQHHIEEGIKGLLLKSPIDMNKTLGIVKEILELPLLALLLHEPSNAFYALSHYLEEADANPQMNYTALSYTWGTTLSSNAVLVNNCQLRITENLEIALRHLRQVDSSTIMWIDALCINQQDISERNHQIQLMSQIYATAKEMVIWLGQEADGSDSVIDAMINGDVQEEDLITFIHRIWKFLSRPWWTRLWVIQEVVFSRAANIWCGSSRISFGLFVENFLNLHDRVTSPGFIESHCQKYPQRSLDFYRNLMALETLHPSPHTLPPEPERLSGRYLEHCVLVLEAMLLKSCSGLIIYTNLTREIAGRGFYPLLHQSTASFEATDPRDHVFALLNISLFKGHKIVADYNKSTADVFAEAMAVDISGNLHNAYRSWPLHSEHGSIPELPSWVPNFAFSQRRAGAMYDLFPRVWDPSHPRAIHPGEENIKAAMAAACKSNHRIDLQHAMFSKDFRVLHTIGFSMGNITKTEVIPRGSDTTALETIQTIRKFLEELDLPLPTVLKSLIAPPGENFEDLPGTAKDHALAYLHNNRGRIAFRTNTRHIGLAPAGADIMEGDELVGLFGIGLPFVLRSAGEGKHTMVNIAHVADHELGPPSCDNSRVVLGSNPVTLGVERDFTIV
jgi:hypothetical protein